MSDTLGAFLAGILLAESKYRFQIEADIAPFRGLLLGLFFITTGFSIDIIVALRSAPLVLGLAVSLHLVKTAITAAICMVVGKMKPAASLRSGLLLSQGGEFAFVIFALAQEHNILLPNEVKLLLTVVVLTMFLTPFLNELGSAISTNQAQKSGGLLLPTTEGAENGDYVLVCGFGRVGQSVCELLTSKLVSWAAPPDVKPSISHFTRPSTNLATQHVMLLHRAPALPPISPPLLLPYLTLSLPSRSHTHPPLPSPLLLVSSPHTPSLQVMLLLLS